MNTQNLYYSAGAVCSSAAAAAATKNSITSANANSRSPSVATIVPSPTPPFTSASPSSCSHPSHELVMTAAQICEGEEQPLTTEHYSRQLQSYRDQVMCNGGETAKINGQLNEIFLRRLTDIDSNANGDTNLKLVTYQEWVDMLLRINESIISNMEGLETEVAERLELLTRKSAAPCRHSQGNELAKCRKDICTLVRLVQNGYHHDNWSMQGMHFETVTPSQVLGVSIDTNNEQQQQACIDDGSVTVASYKQRASCADTAAQRNKMVVSMKALAIEVAEKHDEVRELKKQIACLEDEIQKAQQKIQLKDDVIRELRNDLKKLSCQDPLDLFCLQQQQQMAPINIDLQHATTRSATTQVSGRTTPLLRDDCCFESFSQHEQVEQEKLRALEEELNELFEVTKDWKKQNLEYHRKRLSDIFQKSEMEKADAYRKLDFIRQQLIDLEATSAEHWAIDTTDTVATASTSNAAAGTAYTPSTDCDSGFCCKSNYNQDGKILEALRRRLRKLNDCVFELKKRVQSLEIENSEFCSHLETEKSFGNRNSDILKEIADLLCNLTGEQFSYKDIYCKHSNGSNPFCTAITALQRCFTQREKDLLCQLKRRDKKIEELSDCLYDSNRQPQNICTDTTNDCKCNVAIAITTNTTTSICPPTITTATVQHIVQQPTQLLEIPTPAPTTTELQNKNSFSESDFSTEFWNW